MKLHVDNYNKMSHTDFDKINNKINKLKLCINQLDELNYKLFKESIREKINNIDYQFEEVINSYKNIIINSNDIDTYSPFKREYDNLNDYIIKLKSEYNSISSSKLLKIINLELIEQKYLLETNNNNSYLKLILFLLLCVIFYNFYITFLFHYLFH